MTDPREPNWDDIFRENGERARPSRGVGSSPEPVSEAYPTARLSDPYAVAAAEARATTTRDESAPTSRREARQRQQAAEARRRGADGPPPPPTPKKKRRRRWPVVLVVIVVVLGALGGGAAWAWNTYPTQISKALGLPQSNDYTGAGNGTAIDVTIAKGDTGSAVALKLANAGVVKTYQAVYDYLVKNPSIGFQPGSWKLQQQMSAASAVAALQDSANKVSITIAIGEGASITQDYQKIGTALGVAPDVVKTAAADYVKMGVPSSLPSIEGFLFPATYTFDPGTTPAQALQTMVTKTISVLDSLGVAPADRAHVVTFAALVQREAGSIADMPKVARVFQNRLDKGMLLQSDATVSYGAGASGVFTTPAQRADAANPYNTYVHKGLPAGPIGAPSQAAMDAVLHPAAGSWIYFVAVNLKTGQTVFSTTQAEHDAAANQLYAWCRDPANASYCG